MSKAFQQLSVLVADDSDVIRIAVRNQLENLYFVEHITEVTNGSDAVSVARSVNPNVVILDIDMPGSGIQALRQIKAMTPETIVIILSNHASSYYRRICSRLGADHFIDKSLEFEHVSRVLRNIARSFQPAP